jgi:hypothetical protein
VGGSLPLLPLLDIIYCGFSSAMSPEHIEMRDALQDLARLNKVYGRFVESDKRECTPEASNTVGKANRDGGINENIYPFYLFEELWPRHYDLFHAFLCELSSSPLFLWPHEELRVERPPSSAPTLLSFVHPPRDFSYFRVRSPYRRIARHALFRNVWLDEEKTYGEKKSEEKVYIFVL